MTFSCLNSDAIGWSIFFLIEQVACLLFAIVDKRTWLIWASSIEIFITALTLTGGFNYLWLGIIGIGLIAIVVWQLKKNNDKLKREEVKEPIEPVEQIAEQSDNHVEEDEPKEAPAENEEKPAEEINDEPSEPEKLEEKTDENKNDAQGSEEKKEKDSEEAE
jgi:hypothetical protein